MERKNKIALSFAVFGLLMVLLVFTIENFSEQHKPELSDENAFKSIVTGTTGQGDVAIELRPHKIAEGKLEVDITANTHSVDLSQFDLKKIMTLEFEETFMNPVTAPALSGHHSSGTIVFEVGKEVTSFTIRIDGIPDVEERLYQW